MVCGLVDVAAEHRVSAAGAPHAPAVQDEAHGGPGKAPGHPREAPLVAHGDHGRCGRHKESTQSPLRDRPTTTEVSRFGWAQASRVRHRCALLRRTMNSAPRSRIISLAPRAGKSAADKPCGQYQAPLSSKSRPRILVKSVTKVRLSRRPCPMSR